MSVRSGDTFVGHPAQQLGTAIVAHLWIVVHVYTPDFDTSELAVLVNLTTWLPRCDQSCVVNTGEHPFIHHPSYVYYQRAVEVPVAELESQLLQGTLQGHQAATPALLSRVRKGLHASKFAPRGLQRKVPRG